MASVLFHLKDTPQARAELHLLLQTEPLQLDVHNGLITVEFENVAEDQAMHVLSRAVANHGFQHSPAKIEPKPKAQGVNNGSKSSRSNG